MQITTEPLENRQLRLTIEVDEERAQQAMQQAARQISRQVNIPGFRKGKAPYELVVQRYGEDTVRREAAEMLVQTVYAEALEQEQIEPYAPGSLEEVNLQPFTFEFTIPLPPQVDVGDYRSYRLAPPRVEVPQEQVQQALEEIREQNAILEHVDRPAELGDGVVIDLVGRTAEGTEVLRADDLRLILDAESSSPAPGFAEAIAGMEAGEERTFTLTLREDFPREELQGQEVAFTVEMAEVYNSTLPELDDDLARTMGNFDSLNELKEHIEEQMRQKVQAEADEEYAGQVVQAILEQAQVEYPPMMLEKMVDEMVEDVEQAVKQQQHLPLEDYLRFHGQSMDELREQLEPQATARLKLALVLGEVVTREGLQVGEEEIGAHIREASIPWGVRADDVRTSLSSELGRRAVRSRLLTNKAIQRLVAIARGEAPEPGTTEGPEGEEQEAGSEEGQGEES